MIVYIIQQDDVRVLCPRAVDIGQVRCRFLFGAAFTTLLRRARTCKSANRASIQPREWLANSVCRCFFSGLRIQRACTARTQACGANSVSIHPREWLVNSVYH